MNCLRFSIKEDSVGLLEWDQKDSSVNLISLRFIEELDDILTQLEQSHLKALVLLSRKAEHFCAGADIKELENAPSAKQLKTLLNKAHNLLARFENLKAGKIAAISGACLGGGLEWALTFDYRLLANSSAVKLALPELKLGLIPGFGGCLRLPRQIGLKASLQMILKSQAYSAHKALALGLANELVAPFALQKRAFILAKQIARGEIPAQASASYRHRRPWGFLRERLLKRLMILSARQQVLKKTKGFYPAPLKFLDLIQKTGFGWDPLSEKNTEREKHAFCELWESAESRNLIRIWRLAQRAKKQDFKNSLKTEAGLWPITKSDSNKKQKHKEDKKKSSGLFNKAHPIQHIGIAGAGTMGRAIAFLLADKGFFVRLTDTNEHGLLQALRFAETQWIRQKQEGHINFYEAKRKQSRLFASGGLEGFSSLDLVIEALPEDFETKARFIKEVSKRMSSSSLLASNTSSLSITELARHSLYPENFFGLHFFHPAERLPLVELIPPPFGKKQNSLSAVQPFLNRIGKIPIVLGDSPGFLVNRLLAVFLTEALFLFEEGGEIQQLDSVYRDKLGFALGPFELMDTIGLDICVSTVRHLRKRGLDLPAPSWTESLPNCLGLGKKSGQGFYIYSHKRQSACSSKNFLPKSFSNALKGSTKTLNHKTKDLKKRPLARSYHFTEQDILKRGLARLTKEAKHLLKEGLVCSAQDIDLALIMGAGFPASAKGFLFSKTLV